MRSLIACFLLIPFLVSCKTAPNPVETIRIEGGAFIELSQENLMKGISMIPLATNPGCMIGEGYRILDCTEGFFVLDTKEQAVFRFDSKGNFLNKIGKVGKGPGEYVEIFTGIVTSAGVELLVYSGGPKVFRFTPEGIFIESKKYTESGTYSFIYDPKRDDYFFYGSFSHKILQLDRETGAINDSLIKRIPGTGGLIGRTVFSISSDGSVMFHEIMSSKIFAINRERIHERYRLDFGNMELNENLPTEELITRVNQNGYWDVWQVLDNRDYSYFALTRLQPFKPVLRFQIIYRKADKQSFCLPDQNASSIEIIPAFHFTDQNELYLSVNPSEITNSSIWEKYLSGKGIQISAEDNPVIVKLDIEKVIAFATDEKR